MEIKKPIFLKSSTQLSQLPPGDRPEYAFVGRSNVGKSSLINMLCRQKVAMTSASPGKTRLINHFDVDGTWYLVDLPGYGYARVSKSMRGDFEDMLHSYTLGRKNLVAIFVLVDSRLEPQRLDIEFLEFLGVSEIPFAIVFTKMDKLSGTERSKNVAAYKRLLKKNWEELPTMFYSSAETGEGRVEILHFIGENLEHFEKG
jgi:GTP-binding protein